MIAFLRKHSQLLAMAALAAYCALQISGGLTEGFTQDDLMNLQRAVFTSWRRLFLDCLLLWRPSDSFRPLGEVTYKILWTAFHFNPYPYHLACLGLVVANSVLSYLLVRAIVNDRTLSLIAAWCFAYHGSFWGMYANTGVIFDIQTIGFYFLALLCTAWRPQDVGLNTMRAAAIVVLTAASLNSKEIGVSLPFAILVLSVLEYLSGPRTDWPRLWWNVACATMSFLTTAAFVFGRVLGHGGLAHASSYEVNLAFDQFSGNLAHFLRDLLYDGVAWTNHSALLFFVFAAALFTLLRWGRELILLLMALVSFLPMAFIPTRGLDASYLSVFWLVLTLSCALQKAALRWPLWRAAPFILFAVVTASQFTIGRISFPFFREESEDISLAYAGIRSALTTLPPHGSVAFAEDHFAPQFPWATTFIALLATERDDFSWARVEDLAVSNAGRPPGQQFDLVLRVPRRQSVLSCVGEHGSRLTRQAIAAGQYTCVPVPRAIHDARRIRN